MIVGVAVVAVGLLVAVAGAVVAWQRDVQRLGLLSAAGSEGIVLHEHGRILDINPVITAMLGWTRAEARGRPLLDFVPEAIRAQVRAQIEVAGTYEVDVARKNGSTFPAEITGRNVIFGRRTVRVAAIRDITERRRVIDALARSQTGFRDMIERLPVGVILHFQGIVRYANPAILQMIASTPEQVLGKSLFDWVVPEDRALVAARVRELIERDRPVAPASIRVNARDGRIVVAETVPLRMLEFEGLPCNLVVLNDITERLAMEARLQLADRLASVGTLAAGVAHEVNNPLAYVIGNLELAAKDVDNLRNGPDAAIVDRLDRELKDALGGAERVARIVQDLKTLSRSGEDRASPVDVHEVLEAAIRIGWNEIRHRAQLVRAFGDIPRVLANESRLAQVFLNLLINAAQAITDGEADKNQIVLSTFAAGGFVVIEVRDTGRGITIADRKRIFDPFFTTKPVGVGTGLGLSIAHGIVTGLGGEIGVDSQPGCGATFRVSLPAVPLHAVDAPTVAATTPTPTRRARILAVDDEPAILEFLAAALTGHEVVCVSSGREAIVQLQGGSFDVVLCDLMMPDQTGMEVYERTFARDPEQAARIVFLTGGAFTPGAREFLARSANARLDKPFTLQRLREAVDRRL